jgi:orotate phosphoribosyltransferase
MSKVTSILKHKITETRNSLQKMLSTFTRKKPQPIVGPSYAGISVGGGKSRRLSRSKKVMRCERKACSRRCVRKDCSRVKGKKTHGKKVVNW